MFESERERENVRGLRNQKKNECIINKICKDIRAKKVKKRVKQGKAASIEEEQVRQVFWNFPKQLIRRATKKRNLDQMIKEKNYVQLLN